MMRPYLTQYMSNFNKNYTIRNALTILHLSAKYEAASSDNADRASAEHNGRKPGYAAGIGTDRLIGHSKVYAIFYSQTGQFQNLASQMLSAAAFERRLFAMVMRTFRGRGSTRASP